MSVREPVVSVLLFAAAREAAGVSRLEFPAGQAPTPAAVWEDLLRRYPGLEPLSASVSVAVNHRFAPRGTALAPGDEVAFLPPVSGG